jgi:hypothetical protein
VNVNDSNGNSVRFSQDAETGFYVSNQEFEAQPNVDYTLHIKTSDGKSYKSSPVQLPAAVDMGRVYAERIVDDTHDGVSVYVDTEDPTGKVKYFRYEYDETYKVVAPYPSPYTAEIINVDPVARTYEIVLTPREPEEICYSTEKSTGITQISTTDLNENRVFHFPIRYMAKEDARLQTRYSILVKQYVQSLEAYTFYEKIKELGSVESLLSQGQPGYVAGNMVSENNPDEKVLGYFEASSMTSKRIYFNYQDFNLEKPPYFVDCEVLVLDYRDNTALDNDPDERAILRSYITYYDYQVVRVASNENIYTIVQQECSVCTSISSNVRPDFWED